MKWFTLALMIPFSVGFVAAQSQTESPPPTVTVASVITDYATATNGAAGATAARSAAEKSLTVAQAAEKTAATAATAQASRLARALKLSGPVVVAAPTGVTVYELDEAGAVRVLSPVPADQVNVDLSDPAPAPVPPPNPDPAPAPNTETAPAPQTAVSETLPGYVRVTGVRVPVYVPPGFPGKVRNLDRATQVPRGSTKILIPAPHR